jgi:hypothetical protein
MNMHIRQIAPIALLLLTPALFAESKTEASHPFTGTLPATGVRRIVIEVPASETTIVATQENVIRLEGSSRREYSGDDELRSSQRLVDGASITMRARGRNVYLQRTMVGKANWYQRNSVKFRFTLYIPENMPVELKQGDADVSLRGNLGDVDLNVNVGNIKLQMPKAQVSELVARSRIGEVTTNLPDRTVVKQGVLAGATNFLNDRGKSVVRLKVNVGRIDVELQ